LYAALHYCSQDVLLIIKVTDSALGMAYDTKKIIKHKQTGDVTFTDANSGVEITLQSSEVLQISSNEYKEGTTKN